MVATPAKVPPTCAPNATPPVPLESPRLLSRERKSRTKNDVITIHERSQKSPVLNQKIRYQKLISVLGRRTRNAPRQAEIAPDAPTIGISAEALDPSNTWIRFATNPPPR